MKQRIFQIVSMILFLAVLPLSAGAQLRSSSNLGFTHQGIHSNIRPAPGQPLNPQPANLPMYNPYFSINFGPLYPDQYQEPCYYNEDYGQWIGPCQTSLDTPGYSITVPNRVR